MQDMTTQAGTTGPKVILNMPDLSARTPQILENLAHIDSLPFDGIVVNVPDSWLMMNGTWIVEEAETRRWLEPLKGVFENLTDNYIRVTTDDPGDLFDDAAWNRVIENWRVLARVSAEVGFKGILFDNEEYFGTWDNFPEDYPADAAARGLEAYQAQAALRGAQIARAVAEVWPDAKVNVMHGPYLSVEGGAAEPSAIDGQAGGADRYELMGAFFTGLAEGAGPGMTIIDGGELYALRSRAEFEAARDYRVEVVPDLIDWPVDPDLIANWDARIAFGATVYTDEFPAGFAQTPESFEETLRNAIATSEEMVVVYSEIGRFGWLAEDTLPPEWEAAVRAARGMDAEPAAEVVGAAGTVSLSQSGPDGWTRVEFGTTLRDAVVVLGPPTANGAQPTSVRVRNVDATGFEMQIDEWDYLDGGHMRETVGWMAIEAGTHRLSDGRTIAAGYADARVGWTAVDLGGAFAGADAALAVFGTVMSPDDRGALAPRLREVGADGFDFVLQGQERDGASAVGARLGWIAAGAGGAGDAPRVVDAGRINHVGAAIAGGEPDEVLLAAMQTTNGWDTATLRLGASSAATLRLRVEEETSRDAETAHAPEQVACLFADAGLIEGWTTLG